MFDFYDTLYFIIVFSIIFSVFYIIFNTFGYTVTFKNTDDINNKINIITSELKNINSKIESVDTQQTYNNNNTNNNNTNVDLVLIVSVATLEHPSLKRLSC